MDKVEISQNAWNILFNRPENSHKGSFGHLLVLAGSPGMTGAATLTCLAAMRSGCGVVTLGVPKNLLSVMEIKLTEVIKKPLPETKNKTLSLSAFSEIKKNSQNCTAIAIGPGLSREQETQKLIRKIITEINPPFIIDADGINAIEGRAAILEKIKKTAVLTPHPAEMGKLIGKSASCVQENREMTAKTFAAKYDKTVLVLKGHNTIVVRKNDFYINNTGNAGMATAGAGDVLTGIIGAFLAQGIDAYEAAKIAVYAHGLAGDLAAEIKGQISLIAGDLIDCLPIAFKELKKNIKVVYCPINF